LVVSATTKTLRRWFERLGRVLPNLLGVFAQWDGTATLLNGDDVTRWTKRSALFGGHTQGPPWSKV
jgi:hypothetical protein